MQGLGGTESVLDGANPDGACEREAACAQQERRQPQGPVGQCQALSVPVCARRHGEIQCRLLSSVEGAQCLITVS